MGLGGKLSMGAFLMVATTLAVLIAAISYSVSGLIEKAASAEMTDKNPAAGDLDRRI